MKIRRKFRTALVVVIAILHVFGLPLAMAAPRPPLPPMPELSEALCKERFDEPYRAGFTNAQVSLSDYTFVESWSGYALQRSSDSVTPFGLPALNVAGRTNVACDSGALSFWFKPYWSSASLVDGAGPVVDARLVELVVSGNGESAVVWSLQSSEDGSTLSLMSPGGTGAKTLFEAEIAWRAGEWRLVTLNYGPAGTELFIDGQRVAEGAGVLAVRLPDLDEHRDRLANQFVFPDVGGARLRHQSGVSRTQLF